MYKLSDPHDPETDYYGNLLVNERFEWGGHTAKECCDKAKAEGNWAFLASIEGFYNYIGLYSGRTEHFWGGPSPILTKLFGMVSDMEKMIKKPFRNFFGH